MSKQYMAIDQYGQTWHGLKHPRKDLMEKLDSGHANKMYIDKKDGTSVCIGYVIKQHWLTVYEVIRMEKA